MIVLLLLIKILKIAHPKARIRRKEPGRKRKVLYVSSHKMYLHKVEFTLTAEAKFSS